MNRVIVPGIACLVCALSVSAGPPDQLLLATIQFDGLPAGIKQLDPVTGAVLGDFIPADFENNGMLWPAESIVAGPGRTILFGQSTRDQVSRYDETGTFIDLFISGDRVNNIRGMAVTSDHSFVITADWDDDNVHRFNFTDGSPAGAGGDPEGVFVAGMQPAPDLDQPQAIEILANGELLVGDIGQGELGRYDAATGARLGSFVTDAGVTFVASILDIDEQPNGDVVTSEDGSGDRIRRFSGSGSLLEAFSFNGPKGVHRLPDGNYLVGSNSSFGQGSGLFRVAPDGTVLETIDSSRGYGAIELITLIEAVVCPCEFGGDPAEIDVLDLLGYLDLWFVQDAGAELTGDVPVSVDVLDLLTFLDCWFSAGPGPACL